MFRKLLSLEEAREAIDGLKLGVLGQEEISLLDSFNRVLAENVVSNLDIPPFDRSTVDGYAVQAKDTFGADENKPAKLRVCGAVHIGELPRIIVSGEHAVEIVTGAPIPEGSDAVVMVEHTEKNGDSLHVFRSATKGENIMKQGSDIKHGETILKSGQLLRSREIGVLAALGLDWVKVFAIPNIGILSTGGEIVEPGKPLPAGKIYDINAYSLFNAVLESGGKPVYFGVVSDDETKLKEALKEALKRADVVLTSGGVSVGPKDLMPLTLSSLGEPGLLFSGIAVKPGKPTTVARIGKKIVFGLPGHPTSALLMFQLLVKPLVWKLSGRTFQKQERVKACAGMRMFSAKGRRTFVMVKLRRTESGEVVADAVETGASGAITTLAKSDGYVEIPESQVFVDKSEEIEVVLF